MQGASQMLATSSNMPTRMTAPTGISGGSIGMSAGCMPYSSADTKQNTNQVGLKVNTIYLNVLVSQTNFIITDLFYPEFFCSILLL